MRLSVESSAREVPLHRGRYGHRPRSRQAPQRDHRVPADHRARDVFTSDLSGKEFALLTRRRIRRARPRDGGLRLPRGQAVSVSTWLRNQNQNVELALITTALYDSRELAMGRMQDDAPRSVPTAWSE